MSEEGFPVDETTRPSGKARTSWRDLKGADAVVWGLLVAGALVMVFPLYWMFATAVRPRTELFGGGFRLLPSELVWSNFSEAWGKLPFTQFYINSIIIAAIAVVVTVFINLLAGYTFAKYEFPGRNVIFLILISTLMIPIQVIMVPEFLIITQLGWVNTYAGVIVPRAAEAFGLFMVRQFMVSIPDELIEAARLDGAGEFKIFWKVVLPLSWPVVAVLTIFTFMWRWNDFAWPLVVLQDQGSYTVPLGLNLMKGQFFTDWTGIMSMSLVSILPMLLVFIFFQRYFIQGIASTGLK
ncbi:MAG: ABC transporter, permease protein 2 (cluster 1, maltose/g3p/polyamine/iron) [uncultured Rubrobacteraceae bacterium]|uniref:ABC transporter, permease protein 2 (Cluster 1, maltose/g3p/polyamine/iron) n=1 Tax=uncultured Rubrobacteraceae bacterium TaxID=349277 RepID=A0A6J4RU31_9ACTN|nr:MAG: ABC transporter, permease protein 2 (cluster 1, maltose/g3p/polyamine/iron) [uncultured Rubrobacteraceae bacterium]